MASAIRYALDVCTGIGQSVYQRPAAEGGPGANGSNPPHFGGKVASSSLGLLASTCTAHACWARLSTNTLKSKHQLRSPQALHNFAAAHRPDGSNPEGKS